MQLAANSDLPFIHYDELPLQTHAVKARCSELKSRGDGFFRRRVQPEA